MDRISWIKEEVKIWKKEGIINSLQSQKILSKYMGSNSSKSYEGPISQNKFISILSIIGAILIGLGMIVFVASNWQKIPSFFKLILLFGTTFVTYYVGRKLQNGMCPRIGHSLLFLGALFTGSTIFLTAQIFHIEANASWLILIWLLSIASLSYGFESKQILVLSLFLLGLWLSSFMSNGEHFFSFFEGFFKGFGVFLFYGLTLYGVGYLHENTKFSKFKTSYQSFGLFFTLTIIYVVIVSELRIMREIGSHPLGYLFLLTAFFTILGSAFHLGRGRGKKQEFAWNVLAFISAISIWIFSGNLLNMHSNIFGNSNLFLIFTNVLFFALVILTVLSGYFQGIPSFVNLGLLFFVLYIGYFYFTTVFNYLPKSLALMIGGAMLIGGGWYLEKKRRFILDEIEGR